MDNLSSSRQKNCRRKVDYKGVSKINEEILELEENLKNMICSYMPWQHLYKIVCCPLDFFWPQKENIQKFEIFRGNFPSSEVADLTRPEQQKNDPNRPRSKNIDLDPSHRINLVFSPYSSYFPFKIVLALKVRVRIISSLHIWLLM